MLYGAGTWPPCRSLAILLRPWRSAARAVTSIPFNREISDCDLDRLSGLLPLHAELRKRRLSYVGRFLAHSVPAHRALVRATADQPRSWTRLVLHDFGLLRDAGLFFSQACPRHSSNLRRGCNTSARTLAGGAVDCEMFFRCSRGMTIPRFVRTHRTGSTRPRRTGFSMKPWHPRLPRLCAATFAQLSLCQRGDWVSTRGLCTELSPWLVNLLLVRSACHAVCGFTIGLGL